MPTLQTIEVRSAIGTVDLQQLPAAASVIDASQLQDRQLQVDLSAGLAGVPGLLVNNRNNFAQDLQLTVRGYGTRSTFGVRGMRLIVDGIPATMPDGQGQTSHIDIGTLDRVEVIRGPYSALYGNASGGVVSFYTETPVSGEYKAHGALMAGSDGQQRLALKSSGQPIGGIGHLLSVSRYRSDGFRVHSAADRTIANARLLLPLADGGLSIVANSVDSDALDPQGLTWEQWQRDPEQASEVAERFNTRKTISQQQLGATIERRIDARHAVSATVYHGRRRLLQFLSIPPQFQANPRHAGGVIELARQHSGIRLLWSGRFDDAALPLRLSAGLDIEHLDEDRRGFENFDGAALGVKGRLRRDENNRVTATDPFMQASWTLASGWTLDTGLRHSRVSFRTRDDFVSAGNPDDSSRQRFTQWLPVASLRHSPSPDTTIHASAGRGFETPTLTELSYSPDGDGFNRGLRPARSTQFELGWRQQADRPGLQGHWSLVLFRSDGSDEIVSSGTRNGRTTYRNAGDTRRSGVELEAALRIERRWNVRAAWTWLDSRFVTPSGDASAGNRLPGQPRHAAYIGVERRLGAAWTLGAAVEHRSKMFADDANSAAAPGFTTASLSLGYRRDIGRWQIGGFGRIDNLFDRRYIGSVIVNDFNGRFFESARGRNWALGVQLGHRF
ncbi:TonB-dependent receptor family protein [Piscinibacter sakaiensis]|uniref:TonB-dependent receptor family protein n=1 Tax=Piscinibacter sakaiensis TaxID=1547922 RepID=UPI003AAB408D